MAKNPMKPKMPEKGEAKDAAKPMAGKKAKGKGAKMKKGAC